MLRAYKTKSGRQRTETNFGSRSMARVSFSKLTVSTHSRSWGTGVGVRIHFSVVPRLRAPRSLLPQEYCNHYLCYMWRTIWAWDSYLVTGPDYSNINIPDPPFFMSMYETFSTKTSSLTGDMTATFRGFWLFLLQTMTNSWSNRWILLPHSSQDSLALSS